MIMYTPLQRFFRMLQPNKKEIIHLYIFAMANGIIALSLPLGIQAIINLIHGGEISASWVVLVTIVILSYVFTGSLQIVQMRITENLQKDIFARSAFEFAFRIPRIKMEAMSRYYAPELMNRFFDTVIIQKGLSKILLEFTTSGLQIIFGLILLSFYHSFFIVFSVLVIFLVYIIGNYIFKRGLRSSIQESKYKYKVAFWLEELARTFTTFKLEQKSDIPLQKTDELVYSYLNARETHFRILMRQYYLFIIFKVLVAAGFLILGGILVFKQQMNIGQFVAAEIVVLLLVQSSEKMLLALESIYDLLTSIEKIGEVTDMELDETNENPTTFRSREKGFSIEVSGLTFHYPDGRQNVIRDLSLQVSPNEKIGITGSSGAGKNTFIKLLLGLYRPNEGVIVYDGLPLENYDIVSIRENISACYQETKIFDGSILENLTMGKEYDTDRLFEVLDITGLSNVIPAFPEGLHTLIGPHGMTLAGAVMQKIVLARCLLKKARLYIIDDILKNCTVDEKQDIYKNIFQFLDQATVLFISKDREFLRLTGKILEMEQGRNKF
jgi:ABC-type bacteriocin/lantibiotic exporter with double-glycine peptidase domain